MAFLFTLFIMHKSSTSFKDANGTATIAIFYFQIVGLLFKDRAVQFGWFVVGMINFFDLGFLRNTESTCVIQLDFYENFYYSIFSTATVVAVSYVILIVLTSWTSDLRVVREGQPTRPGVAKRLNAVKHVLHHMELFDELNGDQLEAMSQAMKFQDKLTKGFKIKERGVADGVFFIVLYGECVVESDTDPAGEVASDSSSSSRNYAIGHYQEGQHYGENALLGHGTKHLSSYVSRRHTSIMSLTKADFMKVKADGHFVYQSVFEKADKLFRERDGKEVKQDFIKYDEDGNAEIDRAEAERWLRARRFDPTPEFVSTLYAKFDSNGDGAINREAFSDVLRKADELEDHFNHFDANSSGNIDSEELGNLLKACGQEISSSSKKFDALMKHLDVDESGTIDFDEFCEMMLEKDLELKPDEQRVAGLSAKDLSEVQTTGANDTEKQVELEDQIDRIMVHKYAMTSQKLEVTKQIIVKHSCCWNVHQLFRAANMELMRIYEACSNPTARRCAVLEMIVSLYGPLTLVAMGKLSHARPTFDIMNIDRTKERRRSVCQVVPVC